VPGYRKKEGAYVRVAQPGDGLEDASMDRPQTRFAWRGDIALAYQTIGEGSMPLLYLQGWPSNVELNWDHATMARFLRGLARSRKLVVIDARGNGCSERGTPGDVWPLETIMDDAIAVMDAAGVERAAVFARHHLGLVACMFAATFPERAAALILNQTTANFLWSEETPWEWTEERWQEYEEDEVRHWGERSQSAAMTLARDPSVADDREYIDWWHRYTLLSEAPGSTIAHIRKYIHADVRSILPSIHVPALVFRRGDAENDTYASSVRFLADRIPGARLEELPGRDRSPWIGDQRSVLATIETFLTDVRREDSELERVLATILFTDIVGSTRKAAELGDAGWRDLVARHHASVRTLLQRFRGQEVDTAGDGFFATFDGPARAIHCAQEIVQNVRALGIEIRAGLHTGECEVIEGKVGGLAVNIGARIANAAQPSEVLVSQTVRDLVVGSGLSFEDRGDHELRGVPGRWRLYTVHRDGAASNATG
jgi:class 3 adenylate cyclase